MAPSLVYSGGRKEVAIGARVSGLSKGTSDALDALQTINTL